MSARRVDITIKPEDEIEVITLSPEATSRPDAWITIGSVAIWPETSAQAAALAAAASEVEAYLQLVDR